MPFSTGQIIVWLIVGALSGSLAGMLVKGSRQGFGWISNLGIGLMGALIGGVLFHLLGIDFGLGELGIRFRDLLSAFIGSFIFLGGLWLARRGRS